MFQERISFACKVYMIALKILGFQDLLLLPAKFYYDDISLHLASMLSC